MQPGKPPDTPNQQYIRNTIPRLQNVASTSSASTSQPRTEFVGTRPMQIRPQPRTSSQSSTAPITSQQHRYLTPIRSAWHSPPVVNGSTQHAAQASNRYLPGGPRHPRASLLSVSRYPAPSTSSIPRPKATISRKTVVPVVNTSTKTMENLRHMITTKSMSELKKELEEVIHANKIENEDDDTDLTPEELKRKQKLLQELKDIDERERQLTKASVDHEEAYIAYQQEKAAQAKFLSLLATDEAFVPVTAALPADVLVEKIAQQNKENIEIATQKRNAARKTMAEASSKKLIKVKKLPFKKSKPTSINRCINLIRPKAYQPDDIVNFAKIRRKYLPLIKLLGEQGQKYQKELDDYRSNRVKEYTELEAEWNSRQDKAERNTRKIHKDNKNRELYERQFPDIRRAREEKERTARSEKRPNAKQEAAKAQAKEDEIKKCFSSAIIPSMNRTLLMADQPRGRIIVDPLNESTNNLRVFLQSWTTLEKQTFQRKFMYYGKNFPAIAACVATKTASDCVRYFYLTKQHVKYKQLQKKQKRKKAGKQYKPTMVPTQGEIMIERIRAFPFMKTNKYVECLICETQMVVFMVPQFANGRPITGKYVETVDDKLPICDACNSHIRKAKAANFSKCPLKSCALSGRKKAKPSRTIPDTANKLRDLDKRRFIIHHRKLHPEAVKCCGSCIRKIQNDFISLASGSLNKQIIEFNRNRRLKKLQKESENIPVWNNRQVQKLREAILVFGIGNWYEVACRLNVVDKTPYFCYVKYQQMVKSGEWAAFAEDSEVKVVSNVNLEENAAVGYINNLVIDGGEKENCVSTFKVKEEIVSPSTSPKLIKIEVDEEEPEPDFVYPPDDHEFSKRELELMRHFYQEAIAALQEQEGIRTEEYLVPEESLRRKEPILDIIIDTTQPPMPNSHLEPIKEDDDIQIIEVLPAPKRAPMVGSLTQGTPRTDPKAMQQYKSPLPQIPLSQTAVNAAPAPRLMLPSSSLENFATLSQGPMLSQTSIDLLAAVISSASMMASPQQPVSSSAIPSSLLFMSTPAPIVQRSEATISKTAPISISESVNIPREPQASTSSGSVPAIFEEFTKNQLKTMLQPSKNIDNDIKALFKSTPFSTSSEKVTSSSTHGQTMESTPIVNFFNMKPQNLRETSPSPPPPPAIHIPASTSPPSSALLTSSKTLTMTTPLPVTSEPLKASTPAIVVTTSKSPKPTAGLRYPLASSPIIRDPSKMPRPTIESPEPKEIDLTPTPYQNMKASSFAEPTFTGPIKIGSKKVGRPKKKKAHGSKPLVQAKLSVVLKKKKKQTKLVIKKRKKGKKVVKRISEERRISGRVKQEEGDVPVLGKAFKAPMSDFVDSFQKLSDHPCPAPGPTVSFDPKSTTGLDIKKLNKTKLRVLSAELLKRNHDYYLTEESLKQSTPFERLMEFDRYRLCAKAAFPKANIPIKIEIDEDISTVPTSSNMGETQADKSKPSKPSRKKATSAPAVEKSKALTEPLTITTTNTTTKPAPKSAPVRKSKLHKRASFYSPGYRADDHLVIEHKQKLMPEKQQEHEKLRKQQDQEKGKGRKKQKQEKRKKRHEQEEQQKKEEQEPQVQQKPAARRGRPKTVDLKRKSGVATVCLPEATATTSKRVAIRVPRRLPRKHSTRAQAAVPSSPPKASPILQTADIISSKASITDTLSTLSPGVTVSLSDLNVDELLREDTPPHSTALNPVSESSLRSSRLNLGEPRAISPYPVNVDALLAEEPMTEEESQMKPEPMELDIPKSPNLLSNRIEIQSLGYPPGYIPPPQSVQQVFGEFDTPASPDGQPTVLRGYAATSSSTLSSSSASLHKPVRSPLASSSHSSHAAAASFSSISSSNDDDDPFYQEAKEIILDFEGDVSDDDEEEYRNRYLNLPSYLFPEPVDPLSEENKKRIAHRVAAYPSYYEPGYEASDCESTCSDSKICRRRKKRRRYFRAVSNEPDSTVLKDSIPFQVCPHLISNNLVSIGESTSTPSLIEEPTWAGYIQGLNSRNIALVEGCEGLMKALVDPDSLKYSHSFCTKVKKSRQGDENDSDSGGSGVSSGEASTSESSSEETEEMPSGNEAILPENTGWNPFDGFVLNSPDASVPQSNIKLEKVPKRMNALADAVSKINLAPETSSIHSTIEGFDKKPIKDKTEDKKAVSMEVKKNAKPFLRKFLNNWNHEGPSKHKYLSVVTHDVPNDCQLEFSPLTCVYERIVSKTAQAKTEP